MASNSEPTQQNTTCPNILSTVIEKVIPSLVIRYDTIEDDEILLTDRCDTHHLVNVLEVPDYLSSTTTKKTFEKFVEEHIYATKTSLLTIDALRQIALLMHQMKIIDLEISLWSICMKSGTAGIVKPNESTLKVWPTWLKSIILELTIGITTLDDINDMDVDHQSCLKFVTEYLYDLNMKQVQIQDQLSQKKKQFYPNTNKIVDILQTFIGQHLRFLCHQYEYKVKYVALNYHENILEEAFVQQKLTQPQKQFLKRVFHKRYEQEKAKQEVLLLRQQMLHNKLPKAISCVEIPLPTVIQSLTDTSLQQELQDRHDNLANHYKIEVLTLFTDIIDAKIRDVQKIFDDELKQFWQEQRSLPTNDQRRLNKTTLDLMDRSLILITNKMQYIYHYKLQQLRID